jgi:phosphatidylglycerophosphate synthase
VRLPLGVLFVFVAARPVAALAVLAAAAFSDMIDGWVARRMRPHGAWGPHRGDWLDPLCDKIFVALAMLGLALAHRPPVGIVALALTREWLQVVAFAVFKAVPALRQRPYNYRAHPIGKATTVVQFLAALALLLGSALVAPLAALAAALGLASVAVYVNRARG